MSGASVPGATPADRAELQRTAGFFDSKSPRFVFLLGAAFMLVLGVVDFFSGPALSLSLFYLMPLGLIAWNLGRRAGIWASLLATEIGLVTDLFGRGGAQDLVSYFNAVSRFALYAVFVQLLVMLHDTVLGERVVTRKPRATSADDGQVQEAISWGTAYEAGPVGAEGFFDGKSPAVVFTLATAFVIMLGVLDYFSGSRLSLSLFYLMPVGLVAWNVGRRIGFAFAVVATAVGTVTDILSGDQLGELIPIWNAGMRLAVYLALVQLLVTLHHTIQVQRDRVVEDARELSGLREMNEVKDTLLHAVSHDLKGPLAGILGAMQTLRRTEELELTPEEVESLHQMIEQSARKMNRLVDDMLDLERLDRGQITPERDPTDIGELARRVADELPGMETHPVRVDADPVLVEVDPGKVERIIENLLTNAGRHTAAGIPVHIEIREQPKGVLMVIEDEGTGIPDELKEELFEPFRQGPTAAGRGVGIGLSLVKRFAELHGGTAVIEDRPGGGARFVISLPGKVSKQEPAAERHLHAV
ncbi:MAG TPA: HAMP domain-containing sensor histidine kinase [Actinomycetota bacterium]